MQVFARHGARSLVSSAGSAQSCTRHAQAKRGLLSRPGLVAKGEPPVEAQLYNAYFTRSLLLPFEELGLTRFTGLN